MDRIAAEGGGSDLGRRALALSLTVLLIQACAAGDVATVADLISGRNANPFEKDEFGRTPLGVACEAGHLDVVRHLIEREGVSPGFRGAGGTTPLHVAARGGHVEVVRYLIDERGVDPSCEDDNGVTPLDCAQYVKVKKFLLSRGARKSKTDRSNQGLQPALGRADRAHDSNQEKDHPIHALGEANSNHPKPVKQTAEKQPKSDPQDLSNLQFCTLRGDLSKVKRLVEERNVDPQSCENDRGLSALHCACQCGHLDIVRYLVEERNCDIELKDKYGNGPIHFAADGGRLNIVRYLIDKRGCDPMFFGNDGWTPLHRACKSGSFALMKYLIEEKKVDCSYRASRQGFIPLHLAARFGTLAMVKYLIQHQRDDNMECKTNVGSTPLHHAALGGNFDIVQYLVNEKGCDPMCTNDSGATPLHFACQAGSLDIVKYLIEEKKADPSCEDDSGSTPLEDAAECGTLELVKYLIEEQHCQIRRRGKLGLNLIHGAALGGKLDIMKYLINEKFCEPDSGYNNMVTPLFYACQKGHFNVVKYLIADRKMDPSHQNTDGTTALHIAAAFGQMEIVKFLVEECNCDPGVKNKDSATPAYFAHMYGHVLVSSYLSAQLKSDTTVIGFTGGTVTMGDLIKLTTSKGQVIRILESSAEKYKDIGIILLKDDTGAVVEAISKTALGNPIEAVRMIYEKWLQEDEEHSWKKLAKCFRDVQLNPLARDIEQHFGLPSPSSDQSGAEAHPSHQMMEVIDEKGAETQETHVPKGEALKPSASQITSSASGECTRYSGTSLSKGLEAQSPSHEPLEIQSELADRERHTLPDISSGSVRQRKAEEQPKTTDEEEEEIPEHIMESFKDDDKTKEKRQQSGISYRRFGLLYLMLLPILLSSVLLGMRMMRVEYPPILNHEENIRRADITAQTRIEIPPDQPLDFHWVGHGFKVHIPAGAISEERGPVTLCIQASLSGDYQLPDDGVFVSGIYWLSLHPPVENFRKKITVTIQHCASNNDLTLSFVTANSTQMTLPYTFKAVSGGSFSEPRYGAVQVDHFSAMAISGEKWYFYAFCTYYIPKALDVYHVHITVTPELEEWLHVVSKKYEGIEEGPSITVAINSSEISMDVRPDVGIPEDTWETNGWRLTPLKTATLKKEIVDNYRSGQVIRYFAIQIKLKQSLYPQSLTQKIVFLGVEDTPFIMITREPQEQQQGVIQAWKLKKPPLKLITIIKYTDSQGQEKILRLINEIQNDCQNLGTHLNIDEPTLEGFQHSHKDPVDICNKILGTWLERGGDHVTWAGLLQALNDAQLAGIAQMLIEALDAYYMTH